MARKARKGNGWSVRVLKFLILGIFAASAIVFTYRQVRYFVTEAELFRVKEIVVSPSLQFIDPRDLSHLRGKSIFAVDLKTVEGRLQADYPQVNHLRVMRKFPDKIYVVAQRREPFAFMRHRDQEALLDREGVVIALSPRDTADLPAINGIAMEKTLVLGKPVKEREVDVALRLIKTVQHNEYLTSYKISSIDVANLSKIYFQLSNELQIIIDRDQIQQKIKKLGIILSQGDLDFKKIEYIDLRFKEPVLGQKKDTGLKG